MSLGPMSMSGDTHGSWPSARRVILVGAGGAVGAAGRWLVGEAFSEPTSEAAGWPWATLVVNLLGCLLIGFAARRLDRRSMWWDALVTGLLGGFTTMSAFAVELNNLADAGRTTMLVGYIAATIIGGVGATWLADTPSRSEGGR